MLIPLLRRPSRPQCLPVARRPQQSYYPQVEALETRVAPAVFNVPAGNVPALAAAITTANGNNQPDTINLGGGTYNLAAALPALMQDNGNPANTLTINGNGSSVAGNNSFTIFTVNLGLTASLTGLTITGGNAGGGNGGGIESFGNLTVVNSNISGNSAVLGGGIDCSGTLLVQGSSLLNNRAVLEGGAINNNAGVATVQNSTITGNSSGCCGGGIASYHGVGGLKGSLTVQDSTIVANSAVDGGGITNRPFCPYGGGTSISGPLTIQNSIIAKNTSTSPNPDISGVVGFGNNNLIGIGTGVAGLSNGVNGNLVGTASAPINPLLAPLNNYGGTTTTLALLPGSPAIDAGGAGSLSTDQRGIARPQVLAPDIGAFESRGFSLFIAGGNNQTTPVGTSFPAPLVMKVSSAFGEPVLGGQVRFTAPAFGASARLIGNPAGINVNGQVSAVAVANGVVGSYQVTVSTSGVAAGVAFTLQNTGSTPGGIIAVGADAGGSPQVNIYDAAKGQLIVSFLAFPSFFTGGVRVALGDVTGDGTLDIICGAGPGGGPEVRVFDGKTFKVIRDFFTFTQTFSGGVFVATGDLNRDGIADIVVGADAGGGPEVQLFNGKDATLLRKFFAFDSSFTGGVRVAAGDLNGDQVADIIASAGPGGGPQVTLFDGISGRGLTSFFAVQADFTGGVYVAAVDTNGDGLAEVIAGAGNIPPQTSFRFLQPDPGVFVGPLVNIFSSKGTILASFSAYSPGFAGGVRAGSVVSNGRLLLLTGAGPGGSPEVKGFDGLTLTVLDDFFAFDQSFTGGVFVAGG